MHSLFNGVLLWPVHFVPFCANEVTLAQFDNDYDNGDNSDANDCAHNGVRSNVDDNDDDDNHDNDNSHDDGNTKLFCRSITSESP